jgi:hypothetical protein
MTQENHITKSLKAKMPVYTCSCGTEILIVPDLKEMDKAIKTHETEHRKLTGKRITQEFITQQILQTMSEHFF